MCKTPQPFQQQHSLQAGVRPKGAHSAAVNDVVLSSHHLSLPVGCNWLSNPGAAVVQLQAIARGYMMLSCQHCRAAAEAATDARAMMGHDILPASPDAAIHPKCCNLAQTACRPAGDLPDLKQVSSQMNSTVQALALAAVWPPKAAIVNLMLSELRRTCTSSSLLYCRSYPYHHSHTQVTLSANETGKGEVWRWTS